jgi:hypothetical protein
MGNALQSLHLPRPHDLPPRTLAGILPRTALPNERQLPCRKSPSRPSIYPSNKPPLLTNPLPPVGRRLPQLHRQTHRHARALKSSPSNPPRLRLRDADPAEERRERGVERMGVLEQFDGEADRFLREGEDEVGCTSAQQEVPFYSFSGTRGDA